MNDESSQSSLIVRVQRAVRATGQRVDSARSGLVRRLQETVDETLAPMIEHKARQALLKLAEPANARRLQSGLAALAQTAMSSGFENDPQARLLFEFVDDLEARHSRDEVLAAVLEHAMHYEQDLLEMLLGAVQAQRDPATDAAAGFMAMRDRAGEKLLSLLCALAALDHDESPPEGERERVAYFEDSPIEERFKPLARMALGQEGAFSQAGVDASPTENSGPEDPAKAASGGLIKRAVARLGKEQPEAGRTSALARLIPSLRDPSTRFVTVSYLFFVQSYLVRALIEELPQMLDTVRELEQEAERGVEETDVVDIDK